MPPSGGPPDKPGGPLVSPGGPLLSPGGTIDATIAAGGFVYAPN